MVEGSFQNIKVTFSEYKGNIRNHIETLIILHHLFDL